MKLLLSILAVSAAAPQSRFAELHPPNAQALAAAEARSLADADQAVAEMQRLARTREEKALASADAETVARVHALVRRRDALRDGLGGGEAIGAAAGGSGQDALLKATQQMQETQMSFNLQYLQLQSAMQPENRSYIAVSNILKTKHETVKNSIGNVR